MNERHERTLTVTEAARILGVHPNTLRKWSDEGRVPYEQRGERGHRRYALADLERLGGSQWLSETTRQNLWTDRDRADTLNAILLIERHLLEHHDPDLEKAARQLSEMLERHEEAGEERPGR